MAEADKANVVNEVVVQLEYTLRLDDGEIVESTDEDGPIEFLQGAGEIIPGLEQALYGMHVGEAKEVSVDPEQGYGEYDAEAYEVVPLDIFPEDVDLELGMPVELYDEENDETLEGFVTEVRTDSVLLDMNHPLAGETLFFTVKVVGVRPATPEELAHGHAHVDGDDDEDEDEE
jgi:FKBP-type peptidyl-prolyl cis-trans isomerase SlyD